MEHFNELIGVSSDSLEAQYVGLQMNDYATAAIESKKEKGQTFYKDNFHLIEGGYNPVYGYENRWLIAAAYYEVSVINPVNYIIKKLKGHTEEIVKMAWGGLLGPIKFPVETPVLERLFGGKTRMGFYTSSFLATAAKDGTTRRWHAETEKEIACFQNTPPVKPIFDWTSDNHFAYTDRDGFVHIFEILYKP